MNMRRRIAPERKFVGWFRSVPRSELLVIVVAICLVLDLFIN
jgi:hypothetical protein